MEPRIARKALVKEGGWCLTTTSRCIYGTLLEADKVHPILDISHWSKILADMPADRRSLNLCGIPLHVLRVQEADASGQSINWVPFDAFAWSRQCANDLPYTTRLGGKPFRAKDAAWPKGPDGYPLAFLGQICFRDSLDILRCPLPGDVACIYGDWDGCYNSGSVTLDNTFRGVIEWANADDPACREELYPPSNTTLPYVYYGVRCRTKQAPDNDKLSISCTGIGHYNLMPQYIQRDIDLVAAIDSFHPGAADAWEWCDSTPPPRLIKADGTYGYCLTDGLAFNIGDAGAIVIARQADGTFYVSESSY